MADNKVIVQQHKSGQLTVTIPRAIAASKGWTKGTELVFQDRFRGLILKEEDLDY